MLSSSVQAVQDKHAQDVRVLDLNGLTEAAHYFFICSAQSGKQVQAIADHLQKHLAKSDYFPGHIEGYPHSGWVLLDYGDIVFHIFMEEERLRYDLEGLWSEAKPVGLAPSAGRARKAPALAAVG